MDIFDVLTMIGGLSLFLFGMNLMGESLERRAGSGLRAILGKLTSGKMIGFLMGLGVTAVIQSSSATTVMVVGFVNSGLMTLKQAINVIMGANVGTTVTAWILSLAGIESSNVFVKLLKPTSFTPVLAVIGVVYYIFCKSTKKKDTGMILLGFATLMFGMDTMTNAVSGLKDSVVFQNLFIMFKNPVLGVLAGAILTAVIQSSSASVGILQALAITGQVSYGAAVPIIMGQNIGTCVTALLSSVGTNRNARRAALVHLCFNVIGTIVWLSVFAGVRAVFAPALLDESASLMGIAVAHSVFNVLCTALMLPMSGLLERLACRLVPDAPGKDAVVELDERLLGTPAVALSQCQTVIEDMASTAAAAVRDAVSALWDGDPRLAESVREKEERADHCEDILGTYLVKLSRSQLETAESNEAAMFLKLIGDFERVSDHGINVLESAQELRDKDLAFSEEAARELRIMGDAVCEVLEMTVQAFLERDMEKAMVVEPLEQVVDDLKEKLRANHIRRLQQGLCSVAAGFVWGDLLTSLERISDHCSNIAVCLLDVANGNLNLHESLRAFRRDNPDFQSRYAAYTKKYSLL